MERPNAMLSERGWTVMLLGADTPAAAWPQIMRARRPDIAVLSTTTAAVLGQVGAALHAIKTARPECRTAARSDEPGLRTRQAAPRTDTAGVDRPKGVRAAGVERLGL